MSCIDNALNQNIDIPVETFEACWTEDLLNLSPEETDTVNKILNYARDFFFYIPKMVLSPIINLLIIPMSSKWFFPSGFLLASAFIEEMNRCFNQTWKLKQYPMTYLDINTWLNKLLPTPEAIKSYNALELKIKTPDGIELGGHFFKHVDFDKPNSRIMLVFGGNGEFYKTGSTLTWLMKDLYNLEDTPISFLSVNLRGCENSEGTPTRDGLIIDAESLYQFAKEQLGGDESRIDLFGHSLGGTVALQLKNFHPNTKGLSFISRTFNNLQKESDFHGKRDFGDSLTARTFLKILKQTSILLGWQYNNEIIADNILDPTYIFYHHIDDTIPYELSMAATVREKGLDKRNYKVFEMKDDELSFANNVHLPHMMTLDDLEIVGSPGKCGLDVIVEALKDTKKELKN